MKKHVILWVLLLSLSTAKEITLTSEQEKLWQLTIEKPSVSDMLPLGDFVVQVVTPPALLHTISLPFEANIKQLYVARYQEVNKGETLAKVTGTQWISIQQEAIANVIALRHQKQLTIRKNILCKEEIIPQKACVAANAQLESEKIKVSASKALLESYGASKKMIEILSKTLKLMPTMNVISRVEGRVVTLGATPGKSTTPSDALFVIQTKGELWLESNIEAKRVQGLQEGQKVRIALDDWMFDTEILHISPVINAQNQTRQVRFVIPKEIDIVAGMRTNAHISFEKSTIKIRKTSVIKFDNQQIIFVKTAQGYRDVIIEILAEDDHHYFVKPISGIESGIASSSVAILKNMLGENDE